MLNVRRLCVVLESVISATIIITIGRVCICLNFPCLTSCLLCCLPMCFLFLLPVLWSGSCVEVDVARIIILLTPPPQPLHRPNHPLFFPTQSSFFNTSDSYLKSVHAYSCNLEQNGWKIKTTPPPISMMEKMARFRCSARTSLNWGEGYFYFSFYSVQDCPRSTLALPEVMYTI